MGYFANGSEFEHYYAEYCNQCLHDEIDGCIIIYLHLAYGYRDCNDEESILHELIPRDEKGYNMKCKMFIKKED